MICFRTEILINPRTIQEVINSRLRTLYDDCKTEELLEAIQIYADSIATDDDKDKGAKKAFELYEYLAGNKEYLVSYQDRAYPIPRGRNDIQQESIFKDI